MSDYGDFGPTETKECVVCPDCAFTFWAFQLRKEDGTASCPSCEEDRLRSLNAELVEALTECRTDLMICADNVRDAAKTNPRWEGTPEVLMKRVREADAALSRARAKEDT